MLGTNFRGRFEEVTFPRKQYMLQVFLIISLSCLQDMLNDTFLPTCVSACSMDHSKNHCSTQWKLLEVASHTAYYCVGFFKDSVFQKHLWKCVKMMTKWSSVNFVNWILNSNVPGPLDFTIVVPSVSPGPNGLPGRCPPMKPTKLVHCVGQLMKPWLHISDLFCKREVFDPLICFLPSIICAYLDRGYVWICILHPFASFFVSKIWMTRRCYNMFQIAVACHYANFEGWLQTIWTTGRPPGNVTNFWFKCMHHWLYVIIICFFLSTHCSLRFLSVYFAWPPLAIAALCAITFSHMWTRILRDHAHCLAWLGIYILVTLPLLCLAFRWLWYGQVDSTAAAADNKGSLYIE